MSQIKTSLLWIPLILWYFISLFTTHSNTPYHMVDSIYYNAAASWMNGSPLYNGTGGGFVYLPSMAAFFAPLALIPIKYFVVLFRLLSIAVLATGLYAFSNSVEASNKHKTYFYMTLCCVIIAQAALFEGQMHLIITGLMLLGYAAICRQQWWRAAFYLALSLALKPTSIVLFLLALAIYPRLSLKLILTTAAMLLIIFLMQSPSYVLHQYQAFTNTLSVMSRHDGQNPTEWATFFGALAFYTKHLVYGTHQFVIRIIVAIGVFILSVLAQWKLKTRRALPVIFALGMSYLMLFNSRTENNDYIMLAPALGYTLSQAAINKKSWQIGLHFLILGLLAANWTLSHAISPGNNLWLSPTVTVVYALYLLTKFSNWLGLLRLLQPIRATE